MIVRDFLGDLVVSIGTRVVFFLHEWRRCVCRSCTSHLSRVKKELLDRLHKTRKDQSNPKPTKKTTQQDPNRVQPVAQLREPRRHEEGETGVMNSPKRSVLLVFFPRVRTPCGHGAQVIVEGREIQSDGGEKDKENPTTKQPPTTAHRPSLHHPVVFPLR